VRRDERVEVLLDRPLVLRGRRHDLRVEDGAVRAEAVAVVENATRRLARAVPPTGLRHDLDRRLRRLLVLRDQPQRLVAGVHELDGTHDDRAERVVDDGLKTYLVGRRERVGGEQPAMQREACKGADEVGAALAQARVQGVGMLDVLLDDVVVELGDRDVEPTCRDEAVAAVDRVLAAGIESIPTQLTTPVVVFQTHDVVLAKVRPGLNFDELHLRCSVVFAAVCLTNTDVDTLARP